VKRTAAAFATLLAVALCLAAADKEMAFIGGRGRFWAYQRVARPAVPRLEDPWVRSPIDAFILKRLREKQLRPSDPLTRIPLIRRVTFDLTGLPPTPEEVDASLHDRSLDAYEKLVDRLLASPSYGERWALSGWMLSVTRILTASNWIRTVPMLGAIAIT
jgi:hypothetical protein